MAWSARSGTGCGWTGPAQRLPLRGRLRPRGLRGPRRLRLRGLLLLTRRPRLLRRGRAWTATATRSPPGWCPPDWRWRPGWASRTSRSTSRSGPPARAWSLPCSSTLPPGGPAHDERPGRAADHGAPAGHGLAGCHPDLAPGLARGPGRRRGGPRAAGPRRGHPPAKRRRASGLHDVARGGRATPRCPAPDAQPQDVPTQDAQLQHTRPWGEAAAAPPGIPGLSAVQADPVGLGAASAPVQEDYVPFVTDVLGGRSSLDALVAGRRMDRIQDLMRQIVAVEGPVSVRRLARLVAHAHGLVRVLDERLVQLARVVPAELRRDDEEGFVWPERRDPLQWKGFATLTGRPRSARSRRWRCGR